MNMIHRIVSSLKETYSSEEAREVAIIIMEDVFDYSLVKCLSEDIAWDDTREDKLQRIVSRLQKGEPLQYVLGQAMFYGRYFDVNEQVLIPRPETEDLVDIVKQHISVYTEGARVCDVGTGSGCIAITLKKEIPWLQVEALDISEEALRIAEKNADRLHADVCLRKADILDEKSLPEDPWDVIVSNPPYVMEKEKADMEHRVTDYEPSLALFVPDADPLLFYRALGQWAIRTLKQTGVLCCEINAMLAEETQKLFVETGFTNVDICLDRYDKKRFVVCKR